MTEDSTATSLRAANMCRLSPRATARLVVAYERAHAAFYNVAIMGRLDTRSIAYELRRLHAEPVCAVLTGERKGRRRSQRRLEKPWYGRKL